MSKVSRNTDDTFFFGVHFMIDGYGAPEEKLKDATTLKKILLEIPNKMGMYTLTEPVVVEVGPNNKKDPGGLSGFVVIAESHIAFHTFPKRGFVTIDIYTCQSELDTDKLLKEFKNVFEFKNEETHMIERGRNYPIVDIH